LDRELNGLTPDLAQRLTDRHLDVFKANTRGRRGPNPRALDDENEWWALGQHYGLSTPLLDWTRSPYAAVYFAFEERRGATRFRVVFALDRTAVEIKNDEVDRGEEIEGRPPFLQFLSSSSDENPRLVSQRGLFTRAPAGIDIETWVKNAYLGMDEAVLYVLYIPNRVRFDCLDSLRQMNIHHLSLFPDLNGASRFANLELEMEIKAESNR
jgi:hypothetical protein